MPNAAAVVVVAADCLPLPRELSREVPRDARGDLARERVVAIGETIVGREENSDIKAINKWREDEVVPAKMAGKVVA